MCLRSIKNERSSNGFVVMLICVAFRSVLMPNQSRYARLIVVWEALKPFKDFEVQSASYRYDSLLHYCNLQHFLLSWHVFKSWRYDYECVQTYFDIFHRPSNYLGFLNQEFSRFACFLITLLWYSFPCFLGLKFSGRIRRLCRKASTPPILTCRLNHNTWPLKISELLRIYSLRSKGSIKLWCCRPCHWTKMIDYWDRVVP